MILPHSRSSRALLLGGAALCALAGSARAAPPAPGATTLEEIVVTASRADLLGQAVTASQGSVTKTELELRPVFRVGQLFESVPGLVVTVHSGEGKANQFLIRGFNLDHGTDIANFIDDMPLNRPTNAHGQGYSDLNFLMPEIAKAMDYTKGPYYAAVGDFGSVASTHVRLADEIPDQMSVSLGTLGDQNLFAGGTRRFTDDDRMLGAVDLGHLDGPWTHPDDFRKVNAALRYSHGAPTTDGYSLTGMYYRSAGNFTTDQPLRAVAQGLIDRFGTLDPSDGSRSERYSLSAHYARTTDAGQLAASAYYVHSTMVLWNDFTHFLDDPVNGDQEQQDESRNTFGGNAAYTLHSGLGSAKSDTVLGLQGRYDGLYIDRRHTLGRVALNYCELEQNSGPAIPYGAIGNTCNADRVQLLDLGPYVENTTHWTSWLRTVVGIREEYYRAHDNSLTTGFSGSRSQALFQPKANLVLGPWFKTEFYASAGRGFHSDDVRGVFGTVPAEGSPTLAGPTPLLAETSGGEVGLRTDVIPRVRLQLALFQQDFVSELRYDADAGQDSASAPSRRQGVEVSGQYRPRPWVELNTDLAFSKARYTGGSLGVYGLAGPYVANAPAFIGSLGVLVDNLGPWFGGLELRNLGAYPISDGDKTPRDRGYSEANIDGGYRMKGGFKLQVSIYNLLNSRQNAAAYYYTTRLPGEPAEGVSDFQVHPLEPRSARLSITKTFG